MLGEAVVTRNYQPHTVDYELHKKVIRKTADQTVNDSTTLVNDTHLLFAIAANEVWFARFILYAISGTTPDFDFKIVTPGGSDGEVLGLRRGEAATAFGLNAEMRVAGGILNELSAEFLAIIVNGSTAGNVQLQWAQAVQNASDTKVLANSCIIATQLV